MSSSDFSPEFPMIIDGVGVRYFYDAYRTKRYQPIDVFALEYAPLSIDQQAHRGHLKRDPALYKLGFIGNKTRWSDGWNQLTLNERE